MKNRMINLTAFGILAVLWVGFLVALVINPGLLDEVWQAFRGWPLVTQLVVALLTLPVVLGLWILHTTWPIWLRVVIILGLAWVTVYAFFPRKAAEQSEMPLAKS